MTAFLRRFDDAFSRTFTAMAMAEDGTRALALEQLDPERDANNSGDEADPTRDSGSDPLTQSA